MADQTRDKVLKLLEQDWAEYVQSFRWMSPETQSAFLAAQGYARLADLLSHLVAWWEVGYQSVERYLKEPASQPGPYDVNAFNAEAVARTAGLSEAEVIATFEKTRLFLIDFVKHLPPTAFENEKVVNQLEMEFAGHLNEHRIPKEE
jgi:hypothetical protein